MTEFTAALEQRVRRSTAALADAHATEDEYGAEAHQAELDNLRRLARNNGVRFPDPLA